MGLVGLSSSQPYSVTHSHAIVPTLIMPPSPRTCPVPIIMPPSPYLSFHLHIPSSSPQSGPRPTLSMLPLPSPATPPQLWTYPHISFSIFTTLPGPYSHNPVPTLLMLPFPQPSPAPHYYAPILTYLFPLLQLSACVIIRFRAWGLADTPVFRHTISLLPNTHV